MNTYINTYKCKRPRARARTHIHARARTHTRAPRYVQRQNSCCYTCRTHVVTPAELIVLHLQDSCCYPCRTHVVTPAELMLLHLQDSCCYNCRTHVVTPAGLMLLHLQDKCHDVYCDRHTKTNGLVCVFSFNTSARTLQLPLWKTVHV